jgi:hypothetical protein
MQRRQRRVRRAVPTSTELAIYPRAVRFAGGTAAVLLSAGVLAGCGSTYTKADFVASANAICANAVRASRSLPPPSSGTTQAEQLKALAQYLEQLVPIVENEVSQIRKLQRPTGPPQQQSKLSLYRAALARTAVQYRELEAAAKAGDAAGVASAEAALRTNPVTSLAGNYGLTSCANPGATVSPSGS